MGWGGVAEDGKGHQEGEGAWTEHEAWITKRAQRFWAVHLRLKVTAGQSSEGEGGHWKTFGEKVLWSNLHLRIMKI